MITATIPKKLIQKGDLIIIPRKEYDMLLRTFKIFKEKEKINENDILNWSREAKKLKKEGKLPVLRSLKDF